MAAITFRQLRMVIDELEASVKEVNEALTHQEAILASLGRRIDVLETSKAPSKPRVAKKKPA
jgi:hypothetical protein